MRLPPQSSSTQQQQAPSWGNSPAGTSTTVAPSHSYIPAVAPSSRPSTPNRRTYERPVAQAAAPSSRSGTPLRTNDNNIVSPSSQAQNTPPRSWSVKNGPVFPRDSSSTSDAMQQQPPTSPASASRSISKSPKTQRVMPIVQQKQPPPQHNNPAPPGPSPTDYFRNRVKRQAPNGTTPKLVTEPEPETTKTPSGNNSNATTKSNSSSSNSGIIPSSFPRIAPSNAKNKNSNNPSPPSSFTPTTSAFKAARSAFVQSSASSTGNSSTEPEPPMIPRRQDPEPPSFPRRQSYGAFAKSSPYNDQGKQAAAAVETPPMDGNIKPQLSSAMKQVDSYYKKFLAQEMEDEDVVSRSSTAVTNTDVRDELLERLQHEYVTHTQQITALQQQLQEESNEKKRLELSFNMEKQKMQSSLAKVQRQLEEQRMGEEKKVNGLEQMCHLMQKELEEKRWLEEQRSADENRVSELEQMCHMMQKELEEKQMIVEQRSIEDNRISELENMCDMLQKELEEEQHQKLMLKNQFNDAVEEKCMELQETLEREHSGKYRELEQICQKLEQQLREQQENYKKEIVQVSKQGSQTKQLEEQVVLLQQMLKEEKDSRILSERQLKKQAEEKYHELLLTCNSLRTQNEHLQLDHQQKEKAVEEKCMELQETLEREHSGKYRELEQICQKLEQQLREQQENYKKEIVQVSKQGSQTKQLEEQVVLLQQMLKEEKDSRILSERQLKKQAEEKYHELLLTCNSLRTQNEHLQLDHQQKEKEIRQRGEARSAPLASDDIEQKLASEVRRLKDELQQMAEKLERCREPQAVGDIKAMYESIILGLEREKEDFNQRLQTLEHTNSKLKMLIKDEAYDIGVEMVKLLNEDGETAGIMELEEEFSRAHNENQAIQQAMPDIKKTKPSNLTSDGKVKVDPEKLAKMKQQLIDLRVANARYEKQIAFVKGICDQVVESLRQELNDVETEKANFEKDLLSQLAEMARSKATVEEDLTAKLSVSEQTVKTLKRKLEKGVDGSSMASIPGDVAESSEKLAKVEKEKDEFQRKAQEQESKINELCDKLEAVKKGTLKVAANNPSQHVQQIAKLESDIKDLRKKLENSEDKVSELRQTASEQKQIIATLSADLKMADGNNRSSRGKSTNADDEEITDYLARVSFINDQTNSSMEVLDSMLKQLKALEAMDENDSSKYPHALRKDRQDFMSLLSKSKQVREEMKMSLQLIELNLMNQLESIRQEGQISSSSTELSSTRQSNPEARDVAASFEQKSMQIRKEARLSLHKTEQELLNKITSFESEVKKNEDVASQLRKTCAEQEHAIKEARTKQKLSCSGASKVLLNTLNREVHTTVERLREKEEEVNNLNSQLDELRRELNEVIREKDDRIEALESQTREAEEKMKILKGSFSFSDDEASAEAQKMKPSPFFRKSHAEFHDDSGFQDSPDIGYF